MSNTYIITHQDGITKIVFLVKPRLNELMLIIDVIAENYPYERRLWDLREVKFDLPTTEIQQISEYGKQKFTKPNKLALVTVDDLAFGEMRQFEVYREEEGKAVPRVFRNEEDAIRWLKS